jgi:hypothetical protein
MVIQTEGKTPVKLRLMQLLHIVFLVLIFAATLFLLVKDVPILFPALQIGPDNNQVLIVFGIFSLVWLLMGIFWPWLSKKLTPLKLETGIYKNHFSRISNFGCMAIAAFIICICGGSSYIWLPIFIISGIALIFTFPTSKEKLEKQWASNANQ